MPISRSNLADFAYFQALARHRSFRRAGLEVGVSASALSHSLKGWEARIGVRLFNRTSRSVTLTAAGGRRDRAFRAGRADRVAHASAGQTLIVTKGVGWTQVEGGAKLEFHAGDILWCAPPTASIGMARPRTRA